LLVRFGLRLFRTMSERAAPIPDEDGVHRLNAEERAALKRIQRGAIARSALAGAVSSMVAASAELFAHPLLGADPDHASFEQRAIFWAIVGSATGIAAVLEIGFLYWDHLRSVHGLSRAAGLDLFAGGDDGAAIAGAMARAALELPNPAVRLFGVNPRRESSRLRLVFATLVYKAKVSVSNFAAKTLVRRMLGRALVRAWLPFVAVPITATWNGVVSWLIMREARVRAMGPSAASEMVALAFEGAPPLSTAARAAVVRAVASCIVRTEDMHPNLVCVFREVVDRAGLGSGDDLHEAVLAPDGAGDIDDPRLFLERLRGLEAAEQRVVRRVLAVASVIDGRLARSEKRLLREAWAASGAALDLGEVHALRRAFREGSPMRREQFETL
jgi:hypothetical protein